MTDPIDEFHAKIAGDARARQMLDAMVQAERDRLTRQRIGQTEVKEVPLYTASIYVPTYTGSATAGTTTYVTQLGWWWQLGKLIFFTAFMNWSNATGTGNAQFSLPFTSSSATNQRWAIYVRISSITFANSTPEGLVFPNTNVMLLSSPLTNAVSTTVAMEVAGDISYSGLFAID